MKFSSDELIQKSRIMILPTRPLSPFPEMEILNKTFKAWIETWEEVEALTDFKFNRDDFFRQDAVLTVLSPDDEVMGCHLYSFFNLENKCSTEFSFYNKFDHSYRNFLSENEVVYSFSVEYLTVCKDFRRNGVVSLAKAIISLSCHLLESSSFDGILAQTRDDVKVNLMAEEFGGKIISRGFKMNGIDSSYVVFQKNETNVGQTIPVIKFVQSMWDKRLDLMNISNQSIKKEAA